MPAEALACPQCGAPLTLQAAHHITICIYCNATVRFSAPLPSGSPAAPATVEAIAPATLNEIKQLLMNNQGPQALARYQAATGLPDPEAAEALQSLNQQVLSHIISYQGLNTRGWVYVGLGVLLLGGSLVGALWLQNNPAPGPWIFPALATTTAVAFAWLLFWGRPALNSIRWASAQVAPATVLKMAALGQQGPVSFFRVWVQVAPANGPVFQTQMSLPIRTQSLHKLHPGTELEIRYFPDNPAGAVFNRLLKF